MVPGRLGGKALTDELRKLASECHTVMDDGTLMTRREVLAALVWKQALGWTDTKRDASGNLVETVHPPVAWAQQYLFERMEGRAAPAAPDTEGGMKATDKVRELTKQRLNALIPVKAHPPVHKPKQP